MSARACLLAACLLALPLSGQPPRNPPAAPPLSSDTSAVLRPDAPAPNPVAAGAQAPHQDTLSGPKSRADTVLVVKHRFDHREQIITGSVVMTCLALMMVVMNNYNPR